MKKRLGTLILAAMLSASLFTGCGAAQSGLNPALDTSEEVTLKLIGQLDEFPAMEKVIAMFTEKYPNCTVVYECVQNYNESAVKRLSDKNGGVDLFLTSNIQPGSDFEPYALELFGEADKLDLSDTYHGLIENFTYMQSEPADKKLIYAIPLGAELRGMFVNKTLLDSLNINIPGNREEFLSACAKLLEKGYVPLQGNPGNMGQLLMYPYICSLIANSKDYDETYRDIESRKEGVSEYFRDPMELLYTLVSKGYYNYKYVENTYGTFANSTNETSICGFLNIVDENGTYSMKNDAGIVAFMPGTMSMSNRMDRLISDYHSNVEYEFILSPVGKDGGYAYMSPAQGIAVNRNSQHVLWALEFMDFLFEKENNKIFAQLNHITPNTVDAFDLVKSEFDVPEERIAQVGSVTFSYKFYGVFSDVLIEVSKANNPKYMQDNGNGTYTMYPFEYYMQHLEERFHQD